MYFYKNPLLEKVGFFISGPGWGKQWLRFRKNKNTRR